MILISAGHYPAKPGACFDDFCEHAEAVIWADTLIDLLNRFTHAKRVPTGTLQSKVEFINKWREATLAVEIHFNSDPEHAGRGSETLFCPGSKNGEECAARVQNYLAAVMQPDRGVKPGWYQMSPENGPDYFLKKTRCTALIVEPEFIHQRSKITRNRMNGAWALCDGILEAEKWLRSMKRN